MEKNELLKTDGYVYIFGKVNVINKSMSCKGSNVCVGHCKKTLSKMPLL